MSSAFFAPAIKIKNTKNESEIIGKLTAIRLSGYKPQLIIQEIQEPDFDSLKALIKKLGDNILIANYLGPKGADEYTNARIKFHTMLDKFISQHNKFDITIYAAQLSQYYTVISDEAFTSELSSQEFEKFLADNCQDKFGDTQKNAFIVEYKLIKIYNELASLADATTGKIAGKDSANTNNTATQLIARLIELQKIISDFTIQAPDNVFPQYLTFVINYTTAKLLELNYLLLDGDKEKLSPDDGLQLSDIQQFYLASAKQALKEIDAMPEYCEEHNMAHVKGMEYSFGQEILHKFPITDLEKALDHITSLTA